MSGTIRNLLRNLIVETGGAEIAEAAAVLPLMFMILLGIFWFGQAFSIYGAINRAAHEGARAGSIAYCVTCSGSNTLTQYAANAVAAVNNALTQSQLDPTQTKYPSPPLTFLGCPGISASPNCGSVSTNVCVQMPVQLSNPSNGANGACGISVSFQYPYQFWLPFSSLNNQKIYLNASAQVRMENP